MGRASNNVKRILVIEDEPAIGQVCARTLHAEGFGVDVAGDGKAALDVLMFIDLFPCLLSRRDYSSEY